MALRQMVRIAVRPRRGFVGSAVLIVAVTAVGCGHSRQSYRPVYTKPAAVSAPCTNCGSSSAVTTSESALPPTSLVPSASESSTIESTVPALPSAVRPKNGSSRGSILESIPKASIGGEPEFEEPDIAGGRSARQRQPAVEQEVR